MAAEGDTQMSAVDSNTCTDITSRPKRKKVLAPKLKDYEVDIQAYCPECNAYVEYSDNGVVCSTCVAYWHLKCANTTDEEIEKLGDEEFYCPKHRKNVSDCANVKPLVSACDPPHSTEGDKFSLDEEVRNIKVSQYVLNDKEMCKNQLKKMDNSNDIECKDNGKQYLVALNTVTYFIISGSMAALGKQYGIEVKEK